MHVLPYFEKTNKTTMLAHATEEEGSPTASRATPSTTNTTPQRPQTNTWETKPQSPYSEYNPEEEIKKKPRSPG